MPEIEQHSAFPPHSHWKSGLSMSSLNPPPGSVPSSHSALQQQSNGNKTELSRALLASVASSNISTLQSGLNKQTTYWAGVAWVAGALSQRLSGMSEIDLAIISEKLASSVSLPDPGLVQRSAKQNDVSPNSMDWTNQLGGFFVICHAWGLGLMMTIRYESLLTALRCRLGITD